MGKAIPFFEGVSGITSREWREQVELAMLERQADFGCAGAPIEVKQMRAQKVAVALALKKSCASYDCCVQD